MKKIHATLNSGSLEVTPANVTVNVKNVRPYTKTEMSNLSTTLRIADKVYNVQVLKNCEVRLLCITQTAAQRFENINLFWTLYMQVADRLLDSRRFLAEAKKLNQDPVILATNIVARGVGLVNQVAKFGIEGAGLNLDDFQCSLVPDEIAKRFMETPEGLFADDQKAGETPAPRAIIKCNA